MMLLEEMVAIDMLENEYNPSSRADIEAYWEELLDD
jgi:hypothetical protein